jgi:hypothetical protein
MLNNDACNIEKNRRYTSFTKDELIAKCRELSKRLNQTRISLITAKRHIKENEMAFDEERKSVYQDSLRQAQALVQIQNFVINSQDDLGSMVYPLLHWVNEGLGNPRNDDFEFGNNYKKKREGWHNKG